MAEKLCVFCDHFDWDRLDYVYYSTLTGGDVTGGMRCKVGHYNEQQPWDTDAFRRLILRAEQCEDYTRD